MSEYKANLTRLRKKEGHLLRISDKITGEPDSTLDLFLSHLRSQGLSRYIKHYLNFSPPKFIPPRHDFYDLRRKFVLLAVSPPCFQGPAGSLLRGVRQLLVGSDEERT